MSPNNSLKSWASTYMHADPMLLLHWKFRPKTNSTLEVIRASGAAREYGVETRIVGGVKIQLTTPAKTVADCFRLRRYVGLEVALAAL